MPEGRQGQADRSSNRVRIGRAVTIAGVAIIALATLSPSSDSSEASLCIICGEFGVVDALLNVLLFVPIGLGLALSGARGRTAVLASLAFTILIEGLQFRIVPGRDASVGDVVMNTAGGVLGFLVVRYWRHVVFPTRAFASGATATWLVLWVAMLSVGAFSLLPNFPESPYYLHVGRAFGPGRPAFSGRVLSATVGREPLAEWNLPNAPRVQALLEQEDGAPIEVVVTPPSRAQTSAEILDISAEDGSGVLQFEQERSNLVFSVRTGADVLRLRRIAYRLRDVLGPTPRMADKLILRGQFGRRRVLLSAADSVVHQRQFVPILSDAWRLLAPFETRIERRPLELVVSALFLALAVFPAAYFAVFAARSGTTPQRNALAALVVAGASALGLWSVASAYEFAAVLPWEWVAVATGAAVGAFVAHRVSAGSSAKRDG